MPHSAILPDPRNGRRRPPLLLCCLLLLSGLLAASCVESSLPDGAVASVNGKTISLRLVQALMDSRSVDMGALEVSTPESMKNQYGEALGDAHHRLPCRGGARRARAIRQRRDRQPRGKTHPRRLRG